MKGKYLYPLLIACLAVLCIFIVYCWWYGPVTTVIVVRHAEKAAEAGPDPPLSAEGVARAQDLSHVVESTGIDVIFATEFQRTQATVAPAAADLGLTPVIVPAANTEELVHRIITEHKGKEILIAGHSDTVPAVLQALGISAPPPIGNDYDNLFVVQIVHLIRRHAKLTHLKYGQASP